MEEMHETETGTHRFDDCGIVHAGEASMPLDENELQPFNVQDTKERDQDDRTLIGDFLCWLGEKGYSVVRFTTTGWEPQPADKLLDAYLEENRV